MLPSIGFFFYPFWEHYLPNPMTSCVWMTFTLLQEEIALVWILAGEEETSPFHGLMKREVEEESSLLEGVTKWEEEVVVDIESHLLWGEMEADNLWVDCGLSILHRCPHPKMAGHQV